MFVYVLSKDGKPLMPTKRLGKVRHLLKDGKAKVVQRTPFTIQLLYDSKEFVQDISLGVDVGTIKAGFSASSRDQEYFSAILKLRNDISSLLVSRKYQRRERRGRKTRYRKSRFSNRSSSKKRVCGPSVEQKVRAHFQLIKKISNILPIVKIIIEVGSFNTQKIINPNIQNDEYCKGPQFGFNSLREYILTRDNFTCQHCHGTKNLQIHHIESRKTGGNAPNNLITLCDNCHKDYHNGKIQLNLSRGKPLKDASNMNRLSSILEKRLANSFSQVEKTFGYITEKNRKLMNYDKSHQIDALCITGNFNAVRLKNYFYYLSIRKHNRQLHSSKPQRGGKRKRTLCQKYVCGFQLFDKVIILDTGEIGYVFGRRERGSFLIKNIFGEKIREKTYKKLKLLETRKTFICDLRRYNNAD